MVAVAVAVVEGHAPVVAAAVVVAWHHETMRPDPQGGWAASAAEDDDSFLLPPCLWTLSLMSSSRDSPHFRLQGHYKA